MKKCWLNGKTVIISGASGGLGFSIAKMLIEKFDCKIIGIARNEKKIKNNILTLGDKAENFSYYLFDVGQKENWVNFAKELENKGVIPDLLINNAGFMLPFKRFEKISDQEIDEIVGVNFMANLYSIKTLMPLLKQSSSPAIVNISSSAGLCAVVGESMYCATKFAVKGFTETLMQEYKNFYIGGVYPGFIKTDILNRMDDSAKQNKLINNFMMPLNKATRIIVRKIKRKKKRVVLGFDGRSMGFFSRIMPIATPSIVTTVLKSSKLPMFDELFGD
jgi:short-subunit dehydrogenase